MSSDISVFNKGSIMPSIIEMETDLQESENQSKKLAEEKIRQARMTAKKILDDTIKELSLIETEERKRLSDDVDKRAEKLKDSEDLELKKLENAIENNRKNAINYILKSVIPDWDGHLPD